MSTRPSVAMLFACAAAAAACGAHGASGAADPARAAPPAPRGANSPPSADYGPEAATEPSPLEFEILEHVRQQAPGGTRIRVSPSLVASARVLARGAAAGLPEPLAPARVRAALAEGLAFDPAPLTFLVVGARTASAADLARSIAPRADDTHLGIGSAAEGEHTYVVGLVSSRRATIEPFPRAAAPGRRATLRGALLGLSGPQVFVTPPSGASHSVATTRTDERSFAAPIDLAATGRWTVEVVGQGPWGPEVVALLTVWCGADPPPAAAIVLDPPDPDDLREAEAGVVAAVNAIRARFRLAPLRSSPALAQVARDHSEAMLSAGVLAHRLPGSDGAGERLQRAQIPFALVLENVAKGASGLAAHRLAEESPAHRQNMLSPEATGVGVGLARGVREGGAPIVYLTELFVEPVQDGEGDAMPPEARVREAIGRERAVAGGRPLVADPALDELARGALQEMMRKGKPDPDDLARRAIAAGRNVAAADTFVASRPADAARTRNLTDTRFNRVGVAVAVGNRTERFGGGFLWIAVIYTE